MPLRISEKISYAANFWTHPPPPGGVWDKPLEALCRQENLLVTFSHGTNPYDGTGARSLGMGARSLEDMTLCQSFLKNCRSRFNWIVLGRQDELVESSQHCPSATITSCEHYMYREITLSGATLGRLGRRGMIFEELQKKPLINCTRKP